MIPWQEYIREAIAIGIAVLGWWKRHSVGRSLTKVSDSAVDIFTANIRLKAERAVSRSHAMAAEGYREALSIARRANEEKDQTIQSLEDELKKYRSSLGDGGSGSNSGSSGGAGSTSPTSPTRPRLSPRTPKSRRLSARKKPAALPAASTTRGSTTTSSTPPPHPDDAGM